jgi:predicted dehydrogenase
MDFIFPELPAWRRCRELLADGAIGRVHHAAITWLFESYDHRAGIKTWKTDRASGGGVTSHFGSHLIYNLEWMLGPVEHLGAAGGTPASLGETGDSMMNVLFPRRCSRTE